MNSHTNDPLSMMTAEQVKEYEPYHRCDFCSVNVPESTIESIDGYKLCSDCFTDYANMPEQED